MDLIDSFPSPTVRNACMAYVPSLDEIKNALSLVAGSKAGGSNGILPEMVKVCSDVCLISLLVFNLGCWKAFSKNREMSH